MILTSSNKLCNDLWGATRVGLHCVQTVGGWVWEVGGWVTVPGERGLPSEAVAAPRFTAVRFPVAAG